MRYCFFAILFLAFSCKQKIQESDNTAQSTPSTTEQTTATTAPAATTATTGLNWLDIKTAANHPNPEGKMYFVDVYTEWCGWCKVMDKKTFSEPEVQKALNERFHVVKFDAEQKESVIFNNKTYDFMASGRNGINMLAVELLGEKMGFPSYVFLDKNRKPIKVANGFMPKEQFLEELSSVK